MKHGFFLCAQEIRGVVFGNELGSKIMAEQQAPAGQSSHDFSIFLQRFSSKVLWHFTGYRKSETNAYEILNTILETKTLELGRENEAVVMNSGERRGGLRVACVCDIPFRDLRIHTLRYGTVGIAFHKKAAIEEGHFNPVFYVHRHNPLFDKAHELIKKIDTMDFKSEPGKALNEYLWLLGSYIKPSDLNQNVEVNPQKDFSQENNFYYEREWRAINPWKFTDKSIAAIMLPQKFLNQFQNRWTDRFVDLSIISSEMIEIL